MTENEVVWTEKLTERTSTNGIHGTRLEIDKNGTRDILVVGSLGRGQYTALLRQSGVD